MPSLSFSGVTVKVPNGKGIQNHLPSFLAKNIPMKEVLHSVSGHLPKKGLVAIFGPSGSGKTTFLNTVANRMSLAGTTGLQAFGEIRVNGNVVSPEFFFSKKVSFVTQDTCLFAELTPRESIRYATQFTYPHWTAEQIEEQVDNIITALNIQKCADSFIGNEIFRGISGGEAKRVSIGVNIVNQPEILILDEPTTGLDSETATIVIRSILNLQTPGMQNADLPPEEQDGRLIVMTLHQPSSEIYEMIDHIVLLAEGHIVYNGPTKQAIPYFESLGYHLPPSTNPADFLLDVVQMAEDHYIPGQQRQRLSKSARKSKGSKTNSDTFLGGGLIAQEEEGGAQQRKSGTSATTTINTRGSTTSMGSNASTTSLSNNDRGSNIELVNGKERITRAPKHANKYERARYLAHAWRAYEENVRTTFPTSSMTQYDHGNGSAVGGEDHKDRLYSMMVNYHKQHGSKYRLSQDCDQYRFDPSPGDDADDGYNYDDATNPLRYNAAQNALNLQQHHAMNQNDDFISGTSTSDNGGALYDHDLSPVQVFFKQLSILTNRSCKTFFRQKLNLPMKLMQTFVSAALIILLYFRFENHQQSVLQRSSCMYLLIIVQIFLTVLGVALIFPSERGVFVLEQASRLYKVLPYFISKLVIDIPILTVCILLFSVLTYYIVGFTNDFWRFIVYTLTLESIALIGHGLGLVVSCLVPSPAMAVLLAPCTIAPTILFSHIAIPNGKITPILRPLSWISPFWWGLDALMINEFQGIQLGCRDQELIAVPSVEHGLLYLCRMETDRDVFANYSISPTMLWPSIIILYVIAGGLILLSAVTLTILSARISKSVKLGAPTGR